jgi:hypothetical protein
MSLALELRFHTDVAAWLAETRAGRVGQLINGSAQDFADYRARVAYIRALDEVAAECQDIENRIMRT